MKSLGCADITEGYGLFSTRNNLFLQKRLSVLGGVLQTPSPLAGSERKVNGAPSTLSNCCFCDRPSSQPALLMRSNMLSNVFSVSSAPMAALRILLSMENFCILVSHPQEIYLSIFLESSRSMSRPGIYR